MTWKKDTESQAETAHPAAKIAGGLTEQVGAGRKQNRHIIYFIL
jgi:hypothetical protein